MDEAKIEPIVEHKGYGYREVQRQRETPRTLKPFKALVTNADVLGRQRPQPTDREVKLAGRAYRYRTDGSLRKA